MIIALYKHQTQRSLILEFILKPFNLIPWSPQIFHESSRIVSGGAYEIWGLHMFHSFYDCKICEFPPKVNWLLYLDLFVNYLPFIQKNIYYIIYSDIYNSITIWYMIVCLLFAVLLVKTFKQVHISGKTSSQFIFQSLACYCFCISLGICRLHIGALTSF
jgi:hypothetical protein